MDREMHFFAPIRPHVEQPNKVAKLIVGMTNLRVPKKKCDSCTDHVVIQRKGGGVERGQIGHAPLRRVQGSPGCVNAAINLRLKR